MCAPNVDGRQRVMYALSAIRGNGRCVSNIVCRKCEIDMNKRARELSTDVMYRIVAVICNPLQLMIINNLLNNRAMELTADVMNGIIAVICNPLQLISTFVCEK